jgi:hypothetical protein
MTGSRAFGADILCRVPGQPEEVYLIINPELVWNSLM